MDLGLVDQAWGARILRVRQPWGAAGYLVQSEDWSGYNDIGYPYSSLGMARARLGRYLVGRALFGATALFCLAIGAVFYAPFWLLFRIFALAARKRDSES